MKTLVFLLVIAFAITSSPVKSQEIDIWYHLENMDDYQIKTIAKVDNKLILRYNTKEQLVYTYINHKLIDSLSYDMGTVLEGNLLITESHMFICDYDPIKETNVLRKINISTGNYKEVGMIDTLDLQGKYQSSFLASGEYENDANIHNIQKLYLINPEDLSVKLLYDFKDLISWKIAEGYEPSILSAYNSNRGKKLFIETGMPVGGGIDDLFYFIIDMEKGTVTNETDNPDYRQFTQRDGYELQKFIPDASDSFFHVMSTYTDEKTRKNAARGFILDKDFQVVGRMLPKHYTTYGYNYEKGKLKSLILGSNTDSIKSKYDGLQQVTFNYVPDHILEKALYAIYHNQELSQALYDSEFRQLDYYQLAILKNMVFARHNYAFENEFYQAFFNLFEFYNSEEKRKCRTKDINEKLSYHDVQNLEKIKQALKRTELEKIHKQQN